MCVCVCHYYLITQILLPPTYTRAHTHAHTHSHTHMRTHTHIHTRTHTHKHTHTNTYLAFISAMVASGMTEMRGLGVPMAWSGVESVWGADAPDAG